eukprot:3939672-Rhodomonas_salina.3
MSRPIAPYATTQVTPHSTICHHRRSRPIAPKVTSHSTEGHVAWQDRSRGIPEGAAGVASLEEGERSRREVRAAQHIANAGTANQRRKHPRAAQAVRRVHCFGFEFAPEIATLKA